MIDDDLEEILREVDKKIMEYDLSRIDDKSLEVEYWVYLVILNQELN